jgi:hypothetical protein
VIFQKRKIATAVAILISLCAILLLTDRRVLVWERKVNPGESYIVAGYGDLKSQKQESLVCHYFTGRSILPRVMWYSSNNILGRDQCPLIVSGGE